MGTRFGTIRSQNKSYLHHVKWCAILCWVSLTLFSCGPKQEAPHTSNTPSLNPPDSTFYSEKLALSFPSRLGKKELIKAQSFAEDQMDSVVLIALLPECELSARNEQCREITVMTTLEGDSLSTVGELKLNQIKINTTRFGERKFLSPEDVKRVIPALFSAHEKENISFCYVPRHALVIYGPDSKLTGFIELCFECSESIAVLQSVEIPDLSEKALDAMKELFFKYGFDENKLLP